MPKPFIELKKTVVLPPDTDLYSDEKMPGKLRRLLAADIDRKVAAKIAKRTPPPPKVEK